MEMETHRPSKRQQVVSAMAYTGLGITLVGLAIMFFWSVTGNNPVEFKNNPMPVTPTVVKAGERITIDAKFCKNTDAPGRVNIRLVDNDSSVFLPVSREGFRKGCYEEKLPITIPVETKPGEYWYNYRIQYDTNPLHKGVIAEFNTKHFTVVE